jgi:hypothetical protein
MIAPMRPKPYLLLAALFGCAVLLAGSVARGQTTGASPPGGIVFNVRDYGATGDGKALDSPSINKAIDACAVAGGGQCWCQQGPI